MCSTHVKLPYLQLSPHDAAWCMKRMCLTHYAAMQVRSKLQSAMGRPVALDDVQSMTIGQVKALEGSDDPAEAAAVEAEESAAAEASGAKPMVCPSCCHRLELSGFIALCLTQALLSLSCAVHCLLSA